MANSPFRGTRPAQRLEMGDYALEFAIGKELRHSWAYVLEVSSHCTARTGSQDVDSTTRLLSPNATQACTPNSQHPVLSLRSPDAIPGARTCGQCCSRVGTLPFDNEAAARKKGGGAYSVLPAALQPLLTRDRGLAVS